MRGIDFSRDTGPRPEMILWVRVVLPALFPTPLLAIWTSTFAYLDGLILCWLVMAPMTAFVVVSMRRTSPQWPFVEGSSPPRQLEEIRAALCLMLIFFPAFPALFLNQALDFSPGTLESGALTAKHIYESRRGGRRIEVAFRTTHNGAFGRALSTSNTWAQGGQTLGVSFDDYIRVSPGLSQVTVRVHTGLFGFPWYETGSISFSK